jgi:hypothetical protein
MRCFGIELPIFLLFGIEVVFLRLLMLLFLSFFFFSERRMHIAIMLLVVKSTLKRINCFKMKRKIVGHPHWTYLVQHVKILPQYIDRATCDCDFTKAQCSKHLQGVAARTPMNQNFKPTSSTREQHADLDDI